MSSLELVGFRAGFQAAEVQDISHITPIVFVVDDDISVRESLELLIRCEGWQPETFASAQEFLVAHEPGPELPGA